MANLSFNKLRESGFDSTFPKKAKYKIWKLMNENSRYMIVNKI